MVVTSPTNQLASSLVNAKLLPQWIASLAVLFLLSQIGSMFGWTSPYSARLTSRDSPIPLTLDQMSWVASQLNLGRVVGAFIGGICAYHWGSKKTILLTLVPILTGWILITIADGPLLLYISRFSSGLGLGMAFNCFPLFVGEIASPKIRGTIITIALCGSSLGFMLASILGSYLSLNNSALVFLAIGLVDVSIFLWLPETPHHLLKLGKTEAAKRSLEWYRGGIDVSEELDTVQKYVSSASLESFGHKLKEFGNPVIRKTCFISVMLYVFMQVCGFNSVMLYMEIILRKGGSDVIPPSYGAVVVSGLGAITSALTVNMMDKFGRKGVTAVSSLGTSLSMVALGTYFLLIGYGLDMTGFTWLPLASIILFNEAFVIGLMIVPSAVMSELFPANIKSIAACISGFIASIFAFGSSKTYQPLVDTFGEAYVFYIYAMINALCIPFVIFVMPETKRKSLQQIQDDLMKGIKG
ncbi:hypothetical protein QAD02_015463 [Eretmocerus hayati]|uniref:Uncharacterized protein n=1 Tax=Eretmocerus hayati TaxID=131215 RepID=A0ACC2P9Y7_9HYME|nr:hypothetical protein QAD02_015463 [Eretmocerus hayati]